MRSTRAWQGNCDRERNRMTTPMSHTALAPGEPLLEVDNLRTHFHTLAGVVRSVDGVSYTVRAGRTLAVVGESGCGKSMLAYSIMRLLPKRIARNGGGQVLLRGRDLLALGEPQMRAVRGKDISMVFQEPMTSLNPLMTVGRQILESVVEHERCTPEEAHRRVIDLMDLVGIPEPEARFHQYPHHLSGGMRQRIVIAIALACRPQVLIADEPTTALDVTIQAQVLELIDRLKRELGMGVILITHDLGVVAEWSQRVMVMYAGRKVEEADVIDLFDRPLHPYTRALMASMPAMNTASTRLTEIPGLVPAAHELGRGCAFAARCSHARERCRAETPKLTQQGGDHVVACFAVEEHWTDATEARNTTNPTEVAA
jgi:peptide/nickel transport system ATP-binding protein